MSCVKHHYFTTYHWVIILQDKSIYLLSLILKPLIPINTCQNNLASIDTSVYKLNTWKHSRLVNTHRCFSSKSSAESDSQSNDKTNRALYSGRKRFTFLFKSCIFIQYILNLIAEANRGTCLNKNFGTNFFFKFSFKENILIQGNYIHSRKYICLRNMYSFKFKAICSFKETIFIEHCCVCGNSLIAEISIQKLSPATLW